MRDSHVVCEIDSVQAATLDDLRVISGELPAKRPHGGARKSSKPRQTKSATQRRQPVAVYLNSEERALLDAYLEREAFANPSEAVRALIRQES